MSRLLFVDDDPNILESLENLLFERMDEWDMVFASSGDEAIELMKDDNFDILITDMRMPGIDGPQLLQHTKDAHPAMVRMVLSGHAEIEAAMKAIPLAHQYLGKPCDKTLLMETLDQALTIHEASNDDELRKAFGRVMDLPCQMHVYHELVLTLENENASFEDVAAVIDTDPALTTKIIFAANTAFFAGSASATNTIQSVRRLGLEATKMLVMATEVTSLLTQLENREAVQQLQERSQLLTTIVREIADKSDLSESVLAAVVHNLGEMIFASFLPRRYERCVRKKQSDQKDYEIEQEEFGIDHAKLGQIVLKLWKLPENIATAAGLHHCRDPEILAQHPIALNLAIAVMLTENDNPVEQITNFVSRLPSDLNQKYSEKLESFLAEYS